MKTVKQSKDKTTVIVRGMALPTECAVSFVRKSARAEKLARDRKHRIGGNR